MPTLYDPGQVGDLSVPNRIFMAPMTRSRADGHGVQTPLAATYYAQRASAGLIVTEATQVNLEGIGYIGTPGLHTPEHVAAWRAVTDAVHDAGGRIFSQLWHVGRLSHSSFQPGGAAPLAPSAIRADAKAYTQDGPVDCSVPREMTLDDIRRTVEDFGRAAQMAREAGFDGVELHGANGYLIEQFLKDGANQRGDAYGGSPANRMRFLEEVLEAVLGVWPASRVGVRLSPTNRTAGMSESDIAGTFGHVIGTLNGRGLAYLHVLDILPGDQPQPGDDQLLRALRGAWSGFYIANSGYDRARAEAAVATGAADAVAFGRLFLANPDLPRRLAEGLALAEADPSTFYGGDARGYTDYPPAQKAA